MATKPRHPKKPSKPFVIISDVDGTIMRPRAKGEKVPFDDENALRDRQVHDETVVQRLLQLEHSGFVLRFCSGRAEDLRQLTIEQLEGAGFKHVDERLELQEKWRGWDQMRLFKAYEMADWKAVLYIGDQRIDREAAELAGSAFLHVNSFRDGDGLQWLFCWECGCTELRACETGCWWVNGRLCSTCHATPNAQLQVMA